MEKKRSEQVAFIPFTKVKDKKMACFVISSLESNFKPSLKDANIDIDALAEKIFENGHIFCQLSDDRPISLIAGYSNDVFEHRAYISLLVVEKEYRNRHLASMLLKHFESYAHNCGMEKVVLEVNKANKIAIKFYCENGFKITGAAREDSYYMSKVL